METCDICGFEHNNHPQAIIQAGPDGVMRCKLCRHQLMFGGYIALENEEFRRITVGEFTDEYKKILRDAGE